MIRSQILKFNGLDDNCLDEKDEEQCLEDLLKESEETYGHTRNHKQHSNKLLNRYYYKYDPGQLTQKESIDKKSFKQEAAVEDNDFKQMLQNYDPSSSSTGDITINIDLKKGLQKNISQLRDLVRKALKTSLWPQPYYADVRGFNPKTGKEDAMSVALSLPHELMASVLLVNDAKDILALQERKFRHRADIKEHLLHFQEQFGVQDVLGLGLWIDGAPFNHDRSHSGAHLFKSTCPAS